MAVNKLALIRYKTIDDCLRNRMRKWTLDDLIDKVSAVIYDMEGIVTGVSRRTIQSDIQVMRSDKLGYNAPIIVTDKKYYSYEDKAYSITKAPISDADVEKMKEIVGVLKQFNTFNYFDEMSDMIAKLENNLYKSSNPKENYLQFESNKLLKGLQYINPLYQAIRNKRSLLIEYKSFKARQSANAIYFPYLLKEYRNRWFIICKPKRTKFLITLALDRILDFQELPNEPFVPYEGIDFETYYSDLLGVTKSHNDRAHKVTLEIDKYNAPYVLTKPIHPSQKVVKENEDSIIITIHVVPNFELEREILGFGECMKVLGPRFLTSRIQRRLEKSVANYR